MTDSEIKIDQHLFQLVLSLQMAAMQNMGKIMSPITGKVERNLEQARISIDMLSMISEKTKGNLNDEENRFVSNILHELRLNFTDEASKPDPKPEDKPTAEEKSKTDSAPENSESNNNGSGEESDKKE